MNRNPTYVGDMFIVNVPRFDDTPVRMFNGYLAKLVGFQKGVKYVYPHNALLYGAEPGIYRCLGNPLLRLESGQILELPLSCLLGVDYDLDDIRYPKNLRHWDEEAKYKWLGPLPELKCNVDDLVLIAQHAGMKDDAVGKVADIDIRGRRVFYIVEEDSSAESEQRGLIVPDGQIIDVIELGKHSEMARYSKQLQTVRRMIPLYKPGMAYVDEENRCGDTDDRLADPPEKEDSELKEILEPTHQTT